MGVSWQLEMLLLYHRWPVYPMFMTDGDPIICKTYMTRVEGENTGLRHDASQTSSPDTWRILARERNAQTFNQVSNSLS